MVAVSGVTGKLVSCTVSRAGALLAPLLSAFKGTEVCDSDSACPSDPARSEEVGRTTMLGATGGMSALRGERTDSRRDPDGGGDFSRGEIGQDGRLSAVALEFARDARGSLDEDSEMVVGCSCGAAAAESARCIAAAEGTVCPVMLGGL